ncbi:MAG: hemolysin family protein [Bdellovibrionales bacterium]
MIIDFLIVLLLLLCNGFFAMAELAIVSARKARLQQILEEDRKKGAALALELADDPSSFLSIVQIGVTLNSILAGAFSGSRFSEPLGIWLNKIELFAPYGEEIAFALVVTAVSFLSLIIGELVPKRIGLSYAESIAVRVAWFMKFLAFIAAPFVWFLALSTNFVLTLLGISQRQENGITEEEVKYLIAEGTQNGIFMPAEKSMLEGVMRLGDRSVRTLMTPRIDIVWLNIDNSDEENKKTILKCPRSMIPLARGDMEEVLGAIHTKDVLHALLRGEVFDLKKLSREAMLVPDTTPVLRLLDQFKETGQHMAIVIDEYGSVEGLVTLRDVLETIIGDIPDDDEEDDEDPNPIQRPDGSWLLDGMTPIDEIEALLHVRHLREGGEFHTLGGFVMDRLGRLPKAGDRFDWQDIRFEVASMKGRRINRVLIVPEKEG